MAASSFAGLAKPPLRGNAAIIAIRCFGSVEGFPLTHVNLPAGRGNPLNLRRFLTLNNEQDGEAAMVMTSPNAWRCVIVPPPNSQAAIGGALRHAFPMDSATRSLRMFERLLARLR